MKRFVVLILLVFAALATPPAEAASTESTTIRWIQYELAGVLVQLDGVTLADIDPVACVDPGGPQFWLPATASNYETIVAGLMSAFHSGSEVKLIYFGCGNYSPNINYVMLAAVRSFKPET